MRHLKCCQSFTYSIVEVYLVYLVGIAIVLFLDNNDRALSMVGAVVANTSQEHPVNGKQKSLHVACQETISIAAAILKKSTIVFQKIIESY